MCYEALYYTETDGSRDPRPLGPRLLAFSLVRRLRRSQRDDVPFRDQGVVKLQAAARVRVGRDVEVGGLA